MKFAPKKNVPKPLDHSKEHFSNNEVVCPICGTWECEYDPKEKDDRKKRSKKRRTSNLSTLPKKDDVV